MKNISNILIKVEIFTDKVYFISANFITNNGSNNKLNKISFSTIKPRKNGLARRS